MDDSDDRNQPDTSEFHSDSARADPEPVVVRNRARPAQRHLPLRALDVVVLHGSGEPAAVIEALELLRADAGAISIVLVADDDAEVLAEAKRLCIEDLGEL